MLNKRGAFLIEILIATALFAMMTAVMTNYFFKFLGEKKKIENYIKNENVDELLKHFFQNEANCTASLKDLVNNSDLKELKLHSKAGQSVKFYQPLLDDKKIQNVKVEVKNLKEQYGLATVSYETKVLDLTTSESTADFAKKEIPIFVSLNEDESISACLINTSLASKCQGDYKNVVFYNESNIVPVLYNLIDKPKKHGTEYKTTMNQIYNEELNIGVQCKSQLYCDRGEWVSSVSCYNSCQDTVWTLGNDKFTSVSEKKCQPGDKTEILGTGQILCKKNKVSRKKWCSSQNVKIDYNFNMSDYCNYIKSQANWRDTYSSKLNEICDTHLVKEYRGSAGNLKVLTLPASNFGQMRKVSYPVRIKKLKSDLDADFEIGRVSLFARCEYSGFFSILGMTEDSHSNINPSKGHTSQSGRDNKCKVKHITENPYKNNMYLCPLNQKLEICHPSDPEDCPEEKTVRQLYPKLPHPFTTHLPQGLPIRFFYSYSSSEKDKSFSAFYTAMCDKQNFCSSSNCLPQKSSGSNFRIIKAQQHCGGDSPQLDMVFVIDSSGSMGDDQVRLHNNLHIFLDQFLTPDLNLDYNIAVLDTEASHGIFGGNYLCEECSSSSAMEVDINQAKNILKTRIKTGTYGGREYSLRRLMTLHGIAPNFFRKKSTLVIFFLTDEDDQDYKDGNTSIVPRFLSFLKNTLDKDMRKTLIYLGIPSKSCRVEQQPALKNMNKRAKADGATTNQLDLCDNNWEDDLKDFGRQIRNSLLQNTPLNTNYDFEKLDKKDKYEGLQCN